MTTPSVSSQPATTNGKAEEILTPETLGGLRVYRAADLEKPERALIYGQPAAGKTPIVASADLVKVFHPMLVIDCDDGPKSLRRRYPNIRVISPRTLKQLESIIDSLIQRKGAGFRSICLDGVSTVQYRGYEHLYGRNGKYPSFTEFESPSWQNHGYEASAQQMAIMVEKLKSLEDIHLFFTAWAKDAAKVTRQNPNPPSLWEPAFTGAVGRAINGRFDSILYLGSENQNGKVVKYIRSQESGQVMARDRDERLPAIIKEPSMQLLAKHWGLDSSLVEQ